MPTLELKIPPVVWTLSHAIAMWACRQYLPEFAFEFREAELLALLSLVAGLILALAGVRSFSRLQTTVSPLNPERSSALVQTGIYRHTRNPMYLGMLLVLLGWFFHLGNLAAGVFLATYMVLLTRYQIVPEERILSDMYGDAYSAYCDRVSRWL